MEELSFIPSAVSETRWALHMCDSTCSKEGFKFCQLAAIVIEEGGAAHTINQCKQCYNVMRLKKGERNVTASRWREMIVEKALRGKLWVAFDMEQIARRMWGHFTIKRVWPRSVLVDAEKERQEGIEGDWKQASTHKRSRSLSSTAVTCALKVYYCVVHTTQGGQVKRRQAHFLVQVYK